MQTIASYEDSINPAIAFQAVMNMKFGMGYGAGAGAH